MLPGTVLTISFTLTRIAHVQNFIEEHFCFILPVLSCYEKKRKKD